MSDLENDSASSIDYEQDNSDNEFFSKKEAISKLTQNSEDNTSDEEYFKKKDEEEDDDEDFEPEIKKYCPVEKGKIINNRFKIIKKLGWGRFSVVWMVADKVLLEKDDLNFEEADIENIDKKYCVALKIYKSSAEYDEYYQNEKKIFDHLGNKKHPNIVNLLDSFYTKSEFGNHGCLVFELCGQHLLKLLNRSDDGSLPLPIVKKIIKQTLEAIKFLHENNIIHTDIKPENILLTIPMEDIDTVDDLNIKLTDLGSSTPANNLYSLSIGTTPYIPPEVVLRSKYDKSVDIWGIGCLLFELITGECLFDPESFFDEDCETDDEDEDQEQEQEEESKEEEEEEEDEEEEEEDTDQEYDTNSSDCDANDWELNHLHLSLFTKIIGPIPQSVSKKGEYYEDFFNSKGKLRRIPNYIDEKSIFELLTDDFKMDENDAKVIHDILMKMFIYHPSKRLTAEECLKIEWFSCNYQEEYQKILDEIEKEENKN